MAPLVAAASAPLFAFASWLVLLWLSYTATVGIFDVLLREFAHHSHARAPDEIRRLLLGRPEKLAGPVLLQMVDVMIPGADVAVKAPDGELRGILLGGGRTGAASLIPSGHPANGSAARGERRPDPREVVIGSNPGGSGAGESVRMRFRFPYDGSPSRSELQGDFCRKLRVPLLLCLALTVGAGMLFGRYLMRLIGRAVSSLDGAARGVASERVPFPERDEVERAVARVERFAAGVSSERAEQAESVRARWRFVSELTHDIVSPLTAASGLVETLSRRSGVLRPSDGEVLIGGLARSIGRMLRLFSQLEELTVPPRPRDGPTAERSSLSEVWSEVATALEEKARARSVALDFSLQPGADERVPCDRRAIERVVANLVENAIRYTPAGGRVRVSIGRSERGVFLAVEDTGVGIPPEERDRIFDPLFRGTKPDGVEQDGSGLGLAIVKRLVTDHGGTIALASEVGSGSRFTVELPRERAGGEVAEDGPARRTLRDRIVEKRDSRAFSAALVGTAALGLLSMLFLIASVPTGFIAILGEALRIITPLGGLFAFTALRKAGRDSFAMQLAISAATAAAVVASGLIVLAAGKSAATSIVLVASAILGGSLAPLAPRSVPALLLAGAAIWESAFLGFSLRRPEAAGSIALIGFVLAFLGGQVWLGRASMTAQRRVTLGVAPILLLVVAMLTHSAVSTWDAGIERALVAQERAVSARLAAYLDSIADEACDARSFRPELASAEGFFRRAFPIVELLAPCQKADRFLLRLMASRDASRERGSDYSEDYGPEVAGLHGGTLPALQVGPSKGSARPTFVEREEYLLGLSLRGREAEVGYRKLRELYAVHFLAAALATVAALLLAWFLLFDRLIVMPLRRAGDFAALQGATEAPGRSEEWGPGLGHLLESRMRVAITSLREAAEVARGEIAACDEYLNRSAARFADLASRAITQLVRYQNHLEEGDRAAGERNLAAMSTVFDELKCDALAMLDLSKGRITQDGPEAGATSILILSESRVE